MSNHYHLIIRLNPHAASTWSDDEVLARWTAMFRGPLLVQRYRAGETLSAAELDTVRSMIKVFRKRLASLSWFMKCLNEPIARRANREDDCTGHFWEARFYSQALRSERALIAAMAYVDLNPVRAGLAKTPEQLEYTGLGARLDTERQRASLAVGVLEARRSGELFHFDWPVRPLMAFSDTAPQAESPTLPIRRAEYRKLVDTTCRVVVGSKHGYSDPDLIPILERLNLSADEWIDVSSAFAEHLRAGDLRKAV